VLYRPPKVGKRVNTELSNGQWNLFFSSLAHAEKAAADQCRVISKKFATAGNVRLSSKYVALATDEDSHFTLAEQLCMPLESPSLIAQRVYRGELMSSDASVLERMSIIHLVFEPSALAFLGLLRQHADQISTDPKVIDRIERCLGEILKDEVSHVYEGRTLVEEQLEHSTPAEIKKTKRSIRRHRAFLIAGLKSFFKPSPDSSPVVQQMLSKFAFYFEKSNKGVFA
jgi:uncharacterized ferritin-like protein (DUF455 family)